MDTTYVLGHSQRELRRLEDQSRYFAELTREMLRLAGLARGMRVLDAGCGSRGVSFLAAEIVGEEGGVLGVDRSADVIELARERARVEGLANLRFASADVRELELEERFDAVVGRFVLAYVDDPAAVLRRLAAHL